MAIETITNRLAAYQRDAEHWKVEQGDASRLSELQHLLGYGLSALEYIHFIDETYRAGIYSEAKKSDAGYEQKIEQLYRDWLSHCQGPLAGIIQFEGKGVQVRYADETQAAVDEVKGLLTPDSEFFADENLVNARDKAIEEYHDGKCSPCSEG